MQVIFSKDHVLHDNATHPENARRLSLLPLRDFAEAPNGEKWLGLAHSKEYVEKIRRVDKAYWFESGAGYLDPDTYLTPNSFSVACLAAGAAVKAMQTGGFAVMRPPGHHAGRATGAGFCIFNNAAIAALASRKRVAIIDWDAHHGNGTEKIVKGNEKILYFSTHQSPLYPGTGAQSEGNCINVPLPAKAGDREFIAAVDKKLRPALEKFQPEIVGISAGFDSYYKDAGWLTNMALTAKSYLHVLKLVKDYKTFLVLEGGYNPESVKEGVEAVLEFYK
jgi:acetoin utilization deacetylase AcuC-like enzyme